MFDHCSNVGFNIPLKDVNNTMASVGGWSLEDLEENLLPDELIDFMQNEPVDCGVDVVCKK